MSSSSSAYDAAKDGHRTPGANIRRDNRAIFVDAVPSPPSYHHSRHPLPYDEIHTATPSTPEISYSQVSTPVMSQQHEEIDGVVAPEDEDDVVGRSLYTPALSPEDSLIGKEFVGTPPLPSRRNDDDDGGYGSYDDGGHAADGNGRRGFFGGGANNGSGNNVTPTALGPSDEDATFPSLFITPFPAFDDDEGGDGDDSNGGDSLNRAKSNKNAKSKHPFYDPLEPPPWKPADPDEIEFVESWNNSYNNQYHYLQAGCHNHYKGNSGHSGAVGGAYGGAGGGGDDSSTICSSQTNNSWANPNNGNYNSTAATASYGHNTSHGTAPNLINKHITITNTRVLRPRGLSLSSYRSDNASIASSGPPSLRHAHNIPPQHRRHPSLPQTLFSSRLPSQPQGTGKQGARHRRHPSLPLSIFSSQPQFPPVPPALGAGNANGQKHPLEQDDDDDEPRPTVQGAVRPPPQPAVPSRLPHPPSPPSLQSRQVPPPPPSQAQPQYVRNALHLLQRTKRNTPYERHSHRNVSQVKADAAMAGLNGILLNLYVVDRCVDGATARMLATKEEDEEVEEGRDGGGDDDDDEEEKYGNGGDENDKRRDRHPLLSHHRPESNSRTAAKSSPSRHSSDRHLNHHHHHHHHRHRRQNSNISHKQQRKTSMGTLHDIQTILELHRVDRMVDRFKQELQMPVFHDDEEEKDRDGSVFRDLRRVDLEMDECYRRKKRKEKAEEEKKEMEKKKEQEERLAKERKGKIPRYAGKGSKKKSSGAGGGIGSGCKSMELTPELGPFRRHEKERDDWYLEEEESGGDRQDKYYSHSTVSIFDDVDPYDFFDPHEAATLQSRAYPSSAVSSSISDNLNEIVDLLRTDVEIDGASRRNAEMEMIRPLYEMDKQIEKWREREKWNELWAQGDVRALYMVDLEVDRAKKANATDAGTKLKKTGGETTSSPVNFDGVLLNESVSNNGDTAFPSMAAQARDNVIEQDSNGDSIEKSLEMKNMLSQHIPHSSQALCPTSPALAPTQALQVHQFVSPKSSQSGNPHLMPPLLELSTPQPPPPPMASPETTKRSIFTPEEKAHANMNPIRLHAPLSVASSFPPSSQPPAKRSIFSQKEKCSAAQQCAFQRGVMMPGTTTVVRTQGGEMIDDIPVGKVMATVPSPGTARKLS